MSPPNPRRRASSVPVVPNTSDVRARVVRPPGTQDRRWTCDVEVEETRDVENTPNFVRPYTGKTITIQLPGPPPAELSAGDVVNLTVSYRGDERGGQFVARTDPSKV